MSLPISGGPPGPGPVPTHPTLPIETVVDLARAVAVRTQGQPFALELARELAAEKQVPVSHVFAAAGVMGLRAATCDDVVFVTCVGACQGFGALERLDQLLELREARRERGQKSFDVQVVGCLDLCQRAPVVRVHTPDGVGVLANANADNLARAVGELLGQ